MKILLTNDDGIHAPGIEALFKELKKKHQVVIAAPSREKSSVGHGITLAHPIWYKKVYKQKRFYGYGISGTPADCVKFALEVLLDKSPDLVISGINHGSNDGCSVFYSGTVAGAREAALKGLPAIAMSLASTAQSNPDFSYAAKITKKLVRVVEKKGMKKGSFLNVNVPCVSPSKIKGVVCSAQGLASVQTIFKKRSDPNLRDYYWMTGKPPRKNVHSKDDTSLLQRNYVTVTPIQSDLTDYQTLDEMRTWRL